MCSAYHIPVLLEQSISSLCIKPDGVYVDATFGGGGHSRAILEKLGPKGRLIVMDQDEDALENVPQDKRVIAVHSNFRFIHNYVRYHGFDGADGIIADLGVSSHQFDTEERGFSFRFNSELDMRMNQQAAKDAKTIINSYERDRLAEMFRVYGEVADAGKVADLICKARATAPIDTTEDLGRALSSVLPKFGEHKYLAKIYQALRIEVNDEMVALEKFMPLAIKSLKPGGIIAIITYHSLEDRIVKNAVRDGVDAGILEKVNKKPILPDENEIAGNTRARSAKLRVAQKKKN
ncbi:MAG: 16S rRNA (cytosine(1402)-N(4))-methyltransferase RsmH [Bacteroidales bacterium]|nr:16S rRNA (cytosine(1402)-N(4))-methyltransferase RsmH [Bacteroidales bacterium]